MSWVLGLLALTQLGRLGWDLWLSWKRNVKLDREDEEWMSGVEWKVVDKSVRWNKGGDNVW